MSQGRVPWSSRATARQSVALDKPAGRIRIPRRGVGRSWNLVQRALWGEEAVGVEFVGVGVDGFVVKN